MHRFISVLLLIPLLVKAQTGSIGIAAFDLTANGGNNNGIIEATEMQRAYNSGYRRIDLQAGVTYTTNVQLKVPSHKFIAGNGATIKPGPSFPTGYVDVLSTPITQTKNIGSISIAVTAGSYTFSYGSASTLVVGQLIKVLGPTYATYNGADYKAGWFSRIVSISGTTVTLQHPAPATFTASAVKCWKATEDVTIQDLKIDSRGRTGGFGMSAQYAVNVLIQRCIAESDVSGGLIQGIRLIACLNSKITNSLAYGLDMTHVDAPGFAVDGHNDSVMYCRTVNAMTGISSAGRDYISTGLVFNYNEIAHHGSWTGIDMHANAQGEIAFNKVWMTNPNNFKLHTIHIRRGNTYVHDNICYYPSGGVSLLGAYMFEQGFYNNTIINNTFYYKTIAPTAVYHNTSSLSGAVTGETAFNNPVIQMTTIPAEPLAEIMDGGTTPPVIDTGVVIIPPVVIEPTTECDCYFETVHFLPKQ